MHALKPSARTTAPRPRARTPWRLAATIGLLALGLTAGTLPPASAATPAPAARATVTTPTAVLPAPAVQYSSSPKACTVSLSPAERATLLKASDTSTLKEVPDALARIKTINSILAVRGDARGTFPVFYEVILERTLHVMSTEHFNDPVWSKKIALEFVSEYLRSLHGHLSGGKVTAYWKDFYTLAAGCKNSTGRLAAQALVTHMVDDFPRALLAVGTKATDQADFLHYGDALIEATPTIVERIKRYYGADLQPLFSLYLLGELFGPSRVTTAFFTTVRGLAWTNFTVLQGSPIMGNAKITFYWTTASTLMLGYELRGML